MNFYLGVCLDGSGIFDLCSLQASLLEAAAEEAQVGVDGGLSKRGTQHGMELNAIKSALL